MEVINIKQRSEDFIKNKKAELAFQLKEAGIDFETNDLLLLEKKITIIKNMFASNETNFVDIHYGKDKTQPMLTEINIQMLLDNLEYKITYDEIFNNIFLYDRKENELNIKEVSSLLEDEITRLDFQSRNYEVLFRKLNNIALKNKINPVRDFILKAYEENKDNILNGEMELERVFNSIKGLPEDIEINWQLYKTWMLSLVACQFNNDFKSQGALTFTGSQGLGKSTWFSNLIPTELKKYFKEEFALNTSEKDNYMESVQYWIVELSELGRTIKDSDKAKSHITKKTDEYRAPYERTATKHKRRTVYGASVDKDEFLKDDVNRRWWTIKIISRFDLLEIDHKKLYAELYSMYLADPKKCHELDWPTIQDLNKHNAQFAVSDDCDSIIQNLFDWNSSRRYYISSSDIGIFIDKERINNYRIGLSLKKLEVPFEILNKKTKQKMYEMPPISKIKKDKYELFLDMRYQEVHENIRRDGFEND